MNYVFIVMILISIFFGICSGNIDKVSESIFQGCKKTIELSLYICPIMGFWLGIVKISQDSGLIERISKLMSVFFSLIFDEVPKGSKVIGDIGLNFCANAFGLANAATPIGIKAMIELNRLNVDKSSASNSMCMLLAMNTAGFQIFPATAVAILKANGCENPMEIVLPTLIVTIISFVSAIILSKVFAKIYPKQDICENIQKERVL